MPPSHALCCIYTIKTVTKFLYSECKYRVCSVNMFCMTIIHLLSSARMKDNMLTVISFRSDDNKTNEIIIIRNQQKKNKRTKIANYWNGKNQLQSEASFSKIDVLLCVLCIFKCFYQFLQEKNIFRMADSDKYGMRMAQYSW